MKYSTHPYLTPGIPLQDFKAPFSKTNFKVPVLEYPISVRENFKRAYTRDNPLWLPCSDNETDSILLAEVTGAPEMDWTIDHRYDWTDWFNCEWTFVNEVGGSMLKPGTHDRCNRARVPRPLSVL